MALSVVTANFQTKKVSLTASTTLTPTNAPTLGNLIVVGVIGAYPTTNPSSTSISDDQTNSYALIGSIKSTGGGVSGSALLYAKAVSGTKPVLTISGLPSDAVACIFFMEIGGAEKAIPFLAGESSATQGVASGTGTFSSGSVTNSKNRSIFVNVAADAGPSNPATISVAGPWTLDTNLKNTDGANFEEGAMAYNIVAASASTSAAWTMDASNDFTSVIAAFREAPIGYKTLLGVGQ